MKYPITHHLVILVWALSCFSCAVTRNQYGIANIGTGANLSFKPAYRDTVENATYIGGSLGSTLGANGYNDGESSQLGLLSINRAITFKNFNASYGGFIYGGKYITQPYPGIPGGNKSFIGGGIEGDINFNIPINDVDFRIIGLKATYLHEEGEYFDFRRNVERNRFANNLHPERGHFRFNLTSEAVLKINDEMEAGAGISLGLNKGSQSGGRLFFTRKNISFYLQRSFTPPKLFDYTINSDQYQTHLNTVGFAVRIK
ncbi:MAG: hypothetical protein AAFO69_10445 [Bacteroidota bacterium]